MLEGRLVGLPAKPSRAACRPFALPGFGLEMFWPRAGVRASADGQTEATVSPALTLFRSRSHFLVQGSLSPSAGPARLRLFRMVGTKTAPADATNIDKGLTVNLV